MRRYQIRPYSLSIRPTRLLTLVLLIGVLWVLYGRFKDPATWRVLLDLKDEPTIAAVTPGSNPAVAPEVIVAGPNDRDEDELADARRLFELVTDKTSLKPREMHAYWKLMTWSRTEPFHELQHRARHDVAFTQLWDTPDRYRGQPISLRLHVRRVLKYDAPSNPQELPVVYEAWGWTDESRSFPYVVVFPECPDGLPVGTDVRGEIQFVGYFLKVMSYTAFDTARGAPLLVGKVQAIESKALAPGPVLDPGLLVAIAALGTVVAGVVVWFQYRSRRSVRRISALPENVTVVPSAVDPEQPIVLPGLDSHEIHSPLPVASDRIEAESHVSAT